MNRSLLSGISLLFCVALATASFGQKAKPKAASSKPRPMVFAVLNDGSVIEPIGYVEKGKITPAIDNASEPAKIAAFHRSYYKAGSTYPLIFGGAASGKVTVKSADPKAECSASTASVTFSSTRAKLKGNVMALASNIVLGTKASGVRRLPTAVERSEIEALVRQEFEKQGVSPAAARKMNYLNLTSLDVNGDGKIELVGTFWAEPHPKSRALLFFIADKEPDEKYSFGATDYRVIEEKDVMGGEISSVDDGVYHERLLDVLDIDHDGVAEVFTYIQSFEGAGFNVYRRAGDKWARIYEGANYHCAY